MHNSGKLFLVATPIGNLGDISKRAAETLAMVDFIAAEDTRVSLKILNHLKIEKPLISYYAHNSSKSGEKIAQKILHGETCALVSDAGHPGISDPGEALVSLCAELGIDITVIPGPCAAVSALAISGLPAGRFTFEGFLSTARKSRFAHLDQLKYEKRTMVFFEAPHKLQRTLKDMYDVLGERKVSISRELTKIYEETLRLNLSEAVTHFEKHKPRGEFVLIVDGNPDAAPHTDSIITIEDAVAIAMQYAKSGLSVKDSAKTASNNTGLSRNLIYKALLQTNKENSE